MKRLICGLVAGLLTFTAGTTAWRAVVSYPRPSVKSVAQKKAVPYCPMPGDLQEIPDVDFCELMRNPERYDGHVIRVRAIMLAAPAYEPVYDHVYLGDTRCEFSLVVNDQFHLTSRTCPEVLKALDSLLMQDEQPCVRTSAKVTVVGRFFSPRRTVLDTGQEYWESERFTIVSVERATPVDEGD